MTSFQANSSSFNMELLLSSITNTDTLIRSYKEACCENNQLKKNLQSISESSGRITNLYQMEKEKCKQLSADKERLEAKLIQMQTKVTELTHTQLNQESIHKQTMAELEERVKTAADNKQFDYIDLSKQFVVQGNVLHQYGLANSSLRKKHKQVIELLKQRGEKYEEMKNIKRPVGNETRTTACSIATMTDTLMLPPASNVRVCDKATMHRMSTATRSTCTSVFIKKMDASTSTDSLHSTDQNKHVRNIIKKIVPHPPLLSPIKNITAPLPKQFRNQNTITSLQNVCKDIDYSSPSPEQPPMNAYGADTGFVNTVRTKEECSDPFLNNNLLLSSLNSSGINPELSRVWQILGETIFTMVGNGRIFNNSSLGLNNMSTPTYAKNDLNRGLGESFYKLQEELARYNSLNEPVSDYNQLDVNSSDISIRSSSFQSETHLLRNEFARNKSPSPTMGMPCSSQHSAKAHSSNSTINDHRKVHKSKRTKKFNDLFGPTKRIKIKENVSISTISISIFNVIV